MRRVLIWCFHRLLATATRLLLWLHPGRSVVVQAWVEAETPTPSPIDPISDYRAMVAEVTGDPDWQQDCGEEGYPYGTL